MEHVTANSDLAAGQLFLGVPEVAAVLGRDARTVRKCLESGSIPGQKVGAPWAVRRPGSASGPVSPSRAGRGHPEAQQLADQVASRVIARLARLLAQGTEPPATARRRPDGRTTARGGQAQPQAVLAAEGGPGGQGPLRRRRAADRSGLRPGLLAATAAPAGRGQIASGVAAITVDRFIGGSGAFS